MNLESRQQERRRNEIIQRDRWRGEEMNYSTIKYFDIANGEGVRTTLFVSGCRRGCPGCFNSEAWDFSAGKTFTRETEIEILDSLSASYIDGLTLLGGEPMEPENQAGLLPFLRKVKESYPDKSIWCFTGELYEELLDPQSRCSCKETQEILSLVDILVDGPFEQDKHDITLRFKGSSNQRIIDLVKTRAEGELRLWEDDPTYATHSMNRD